MKPRAPRPPVSLHRLAERLRNEALLLSASPGDARLTGITADSRDVRPGDLFCAWAGTAVDAHAFLGQAAAAGAVAALVERRMQDLSIPQIEVRDGRRAAAAAAALVYGDPQDALRLAGVTGTNGKTTTVWLTRHILSRAAPAASIGTLGVRLADGSLLPGSEGLTTPGPVESARLLRDLADDGIAAVAMEASSHALAQGRLEALRFDAAVFTNLSRDHLDYHGTMEAYRAAKLTLLELLRPEGVAVLNADEPAWAGAASRAPRRVTFGRAEGAEVRARDVELAPDGARFRLHTPQAEADVRLPLVGAYNVDNALAAAAASIALGISPADVAAALSDAPQVPGRLERVADSPCPVLTDYAHTPDALERALAALRPQVPGRLIVVFGAGGDRDRGKRPLMARAAERGADLVVVTSDNPRTEDPDAIIDEIVAGFEGRSFLRITDRRAAIGRALEEAGPGDAVLLAGKGHEDYQVVGTRKVPFDERRVVREWNALREVAS